MTDVAQTIVAVTTAVLPTFVILVGILVNRNGVNRIDARIAALEGSLCGGETGLCGEINTVCSSLRSEILAARAQSHSEFLYLIEKRTEFDARISAVERRLPS